MSTPGRSLYQTDIVVMLFSNYSSYPFKVGWLQLNQTLVCLLWLLLVTGDSCHCVAQLVWIRWGKLNLLKGRSSNLLHQERDFKYQVKLQHQQIAESRIGERIIYCQAQSYSQLSWTELASISLFYHNHNHNNRNSLFGLEEAQS